MEQRPALHGKQDSSLPLLPIQRQPKALNGQRHAHEDERRRAECTIAWICALDLEFTASRYMLDDEYKLPPIAGDDNLYVLGSIDKHKVVMTSLAGQTGNSRAATVATNLLRSFPGVYATFLVGVGGGAPSADHDLHLGDVVVSSMVTQYDFGKVMPSGQFVPTATGKYPPWRLASAVSLFMSKRDAHRCGEEISSLLKSRFRDYPERFARPDRPDYLFRASYEHPSNGSTPPRSCADCDLERLQSRTPRAHDLPLIFDGPIASGDKLMRDASTRDEVSAKLKALCFEMEAAGAMVPSPCLVVRGICDYADSHKNKDWQDYAAAVAAAYTRLFLQDMQPEPGRRSTFELRRIVKPRIQDAFQMWLRSPKFRYLIKACSLLLVVTAIAVPTVLALLAKTAAALKRQNAILPQILSSADLYGQTFLVARRHDGQLWFTTREGGSWTHRWTSTLQHAKSQPTCLVWGNPKRLGVFYIRDDRTVMTNSLLNGTWGDWETLGAKAGSTAVLCLEAQNAAIHIWIREDTRAKLIQHNYWENSRNDWHTVTPSWEPGINGVEAKGAHSAPAVACRNSTTTNDVIIYDRLGSPYHRQWLNSRNRWGPWNSLGGFYVGDPVLVSRADDRLDFFGVSKSSKNLVHTSWTIGSGYSDSRDLNGSWKSVPSVALTASDRLDVFILSQSGTIHHRALLGSTWTSEWSDLNISATSAPLATRLDSSTPPQIMLQVVAAGGVVMNSEWEATSDGGLKTTVPMTQIGDGLSDDWLEVD